MHEFNKDLLTIRQYENRKKMGTAAACEAEEIIMKLLKTRKTINMIFAAAPSQIEFLSALILSKNIPWNRINAFHMDEYIAIKKDAPQGFANFLKRNLFDKIEFNKVFLIDSQAIDIDKECKRYEDLLKEYKVDITCLGIGENGHLAFNDPHIAFFDDDKLVKRVELDKKCRMQQVNDGCFSSLDDVPKYAITLTIPALTAASYMICVVPGLTKAYAVKETIYGSISELLPASIMRKHENSILFIDNDSASLL